MCYPDFGFFLWNELNWKFEGQANDENWVNAENKQIFMKLLD